jgi:hypothetical protein
MQSGGLAQTLRRTLAPSAAQRSAGMALVNAHCHGPARCGQDVPAVSDVYARFRAPRPAALRVGQLAPRRGIREVRALL